MAPIDPSHFAETPSLNRESADVPGGKPVFDVENLSIAFGDRVALRNVSIRIPSGMVTAIIGPSGCGKSTFLRALNRMHDLVLTARITGKVLLLGQDIYAPGTDSVLLRRRVGMVFQKSTPFPSMSIKENVTIGLKLHGIRQKSIVDERLEKSLRSASLWDEVKDRLNTHAVSLSGGQQQRLCIARTLAIQPDVLLMDEPTSALDPIATAKIEELILNLKKEVSVVIVTHNMQQASRVSDLTAFFHMGDLIEFNATPAIFTHPRQQKTEDYISGRFG